MLRLKTNFVAVCIKDYCYNCGLCQIPRELCIAQLSYMFLLLATFVHKFQTYLSNIQQNRQETGGTCDSCQVDCTSRVGHLKPIKKLFSFWKMRSNKCELEKTFRVIYSREGTVQTSFPICPYSLYFSARENLQIEFIWSIK